MESHNSENNLIARCKHSCEKVWIVREKVAITFFIFLFSVLSSETSFHTKHMSENLNEL